MTQRFVVTGIGKKGYDKDQTVYLDHDSHSGGYPYWTNRPQSAHTFDSVEKALADISSCDYMFQNAHSVKVCTMEYVFTPVQEVGPNVVNIQKNIDKERAALNEHVTNLENASKRNDTASIVKYSAAIGECAKNICQLERALQSISN